MAAWRHAALRLARADLFFSRNFPAHSCLPLF
jgi:hypothetical protein